MKAVELQLVQRLSPFCGEWKRFAENAVKCMYLPAILQGVLQENIYWRFPCPPRPSARDGRNVSFGHPRAYGGVRLES